MQISEKSPDESLKSGRKRVVVNFLFELILTLNTKKRKRYHINIRKNIFDLFFYFSSINHVYTNVRVLSRDDEILNIASSSKRIYLAETVK